MPQKQPTYSSYIKDMPFLFLETRKAAALLTQDETPESIVTLSVEQDIFQLSKERRRLKLAQKVASRLAGLPASLVVHIAYGQEESARLAALYALLKSDLLFFEFMRDVFEDKLRIGQSEISDGDMVAFLTRKASESEKIAAWSPNNMGRVKNTYKIILVEAGLAKRVKSGQWSVVSGQSGKENYPLPTNHCSLFITKPIATDELRTAFDGADCYTAVMGLEV